MEPENFMVHRHLKEIETFSKRENWQNFTPQQLRTLEEAIAPLPLIEEAIAENW